MDDELDELELIGRMLAQVPTFKCPSCGAVENIAWVIPIYEHYSTHYQGGTIVKIGMHCDSIVIDHPEVNRHFHCEACGHDFPPPDNFAFEPE